MSTLSPAQISQIDQASAGLANTLDVLEEAMRSGAKKHGATQSLCDFVAYLGTWPHVEVASLLALAVQRLNDRPAADEAEGRTDA